MGEGEMNLHTRDIIKSKNECNTKERFIKQWTFSALLQNTMKFVGYHFIKKILHLRAFIYVNKKATSKQFLNAIEQDLRSSFSCHR